MESATCRPLSAVMTSPTLIPADSAGPPAVNSSTSAPSPENAVFKTTPIIGVFDSPVAMISSAILLALLIGMAKPNPMEPASALAEPASVAIAEFTPITRPAPSSNGPPEFPGLIAASVCTALINARSPLPPAVTGRSSELMIPAVTVPFSPSGAPIAITSSPTLT